jgi:hypothetical protein
LDKELNVWATRLQEWVSVLMQGPTGYIFSLGGVSWPDDFAEEIMDEAYSGGRYYEPRELTTWQWLHAIGHITAGDFPPANRALLAMAMTHVRVENYRSAIMDSATAAELTLVSAIEGWVRGHGGDEKLVDLLLKGKTLGGLVGMARDLSISIPPDTTKRLVEIRNRVMHRGSSATSAQAADAVSVAQAMVAQLTPFPFHCDEEANELVSETDFE